MKKTTKFKRIITNPFVQKWFFTFLCFVFFILLLFVLYTQSSYKKSLQAEYTAYAEFQTNRIVKDLDDTFRSYSRAITLLSLDERVQLFLFSPDSDTVLSNLYELLYTQLYSYEEGFSAIDSIYLLSCYEDCVFLTYNKNPHDTTFLRNYDNNCSLIDDVGDKIEYLFREKNSRYPYLLTINIPVFAFEQKALISTNINLSQISLLQAQENDSFQQIFIISEAGDILYRNQQSNLPEDISIIPELCHFDKERDTFSHYITDTDSDYIYAQMHSANYPWYYVTITTPQGYIEKPYNFSDAVFSLLPWLIVFSIIIIIWLVLLTTRPIRTITDFLENPFTPTPENISESETAAIIHKLVNYIHTNQALSDELKVQMDLQTQATFWALQSQINPHFLFNTLNIIRKMEMDFLGYEHEVPELTLALSRLLQYALESTELVPLSKEFQYMDLYFKILNKRYKDKLSIDVKIMPEVSNIYVPKLILQPLIENAVFHGCSPQLNKSNHILIDAALVDNLCVITIQDNGIGMSPETLAELRKKIYNTHNIPTNSIGLQNVCLRLYLTYDEDYHIDINSEINKGTCLTLYIPTNKS